MRWAVLLMFCVFGVFRIVPVSGDIIIPTAADLDRFAAQAAGQAISSDVRSLPELAKVVEHFQKREYEQTLDLLSKMRGKVPELPPEKVMLARLFLGTRQTRQAHIFLEQAASEDSHHPSVYVTFGDLALLQGRFTDALVHFQHCLSLNVPRSWADSQKNRLHAACFAGQATVFERREDWQRVEEALRNALKLMPDAEREQRLARAQCFQGKEAEAMETLAKTKKADGTRRLVEVTMATFYAEQRNVEKAEFWLKRASSAHANSPEVHLAFAELLMTKGDPKGAKVHAETALQLGVETKELNTLRGVIAYSLQEYGDAEALFDALHRDSPADIDVSNHLALVLVEQNDASKRRRALQLAEVNARHYPGNRSILSTLGWVHFNLGHLDQAETILKAAVSGSVPTADVRYYLACVLVARSQLDDARNVLPPDLLTSSGRFIHRRQAAVLRAKLDLDDSVGQETEQKRGQP